MEKSDINAEDPVEQQNMKEDDSETPLTSKFCAKCEAAITNSESFYLKALEQYWHANCLRCFDCHTRLEEKCFVRDQNILCAEDFNRRYGPKCPICSEEISSSQMVRKIGTKAYHISCLCCVSCKKQLATGDEFYLLEDGRVICRSDYDNSDEGTEDSNQDMSKTKRARTFISTNQLASLKLAYCAAPKPALRDRERIAKETGLDMRVVQVWFQNRRAKERRSVNKGRFPWLQTANRRAKHMRSHSWSPGALHSPLTRLTEEEELENDLNDLNRIKDEISNQSKSYLAPIFQPESPSSYCTDESIQDDLQPSPSPIGAPADQTFMSERKAQIENFSAHALDSNPPFQQSNFLGNHVFDNMLEDSQMLMSNTSADQLIQNMPIWHSALDLGGNYAAPRMINNTLAENYLQTLQNSYLPSFQRH